MKLYEFKGSQFTKRETVSDKPDAIAVTLPVAWFDDFEDGEEAFWRAMKATDERDDYLWNQTISNIPKVDVPYVYIVFKGKVQVRLSVVEFLRNVSMSFERRDGVHPFPNKNWAVLAGPVVKAPGDFFMKGFQGFRYTSLIF